MAGGGIVGAVAMETRYTVVVHNASRRPLQSVGVFGGGRDESLGSIPPGDVVRRAFWIQHDGELEFRALSGATSYTRIIDGYVTNGMGEHTTVTIHPEATISVSSR